MTAVALNHIEDGRADGPALLLGGSLGTKLDMWQPQLPALAQTHRIIRFDLRGHGGSPAPDGPYTMDDLGEDVVALLDRLDIASTAYAGLSIGGMIGQWLLVNAPERIERAVLLCTAAHLPPAQPWRQRARLVREAGTAEVVADAVVARWFTEDYAAAHPEVADRHRQMIVATPPEGYAACCEAIAGLDFRAGLRGVTTPTLVIGGAQDPAIPPDHQEAIAAAIPGARLEILDPGAHLASVERAETVSQLIAEHIHV
jgi:3-oxoadipate enol-lactonase